ncbi:MAG: hypothetical protein M3473_02855, partial [Chloroflexota bacterium]|nr:hypothetical protein [Chloroflexota bacterium]
MIHPPAGVALTLQTDHADEVLTPEALNFVAELHRHFNPERHRLLADRRQRQ